MGKQHGLVHLSGRFGDVQMVVDRGRGYCWLAGPISEEKAAARKAGNVGRNNAEFGAAGLLASAVFQGIAGLQHHAERYFRPKLQGKLRALVDAGPGQYGQRSLLLAPHLDFFRDWDLDAKNRYDSRFRARHSVSVNADRNTATLEIAPFHTGHHLTAPRGATHFQLTMAVAGLCDLVYSAADRSYQPTQRDLGRHSEIIHTGLLPCDNAPHPGLQLTAALSGAPVLGSDACLMVSVGVDFYREVNGTADQMATGGAGKILSAL